MVRLRSHLERSEEAARKATIRQTAPTTPVVTDAPPPPALTPTAITRLPTKRTHAAARLGPDAR